MGPMQQVRQQCKIKTGTKRGWPVDCTVSTGCTATINAGVVKPYGQVCRNDTTKTDREKQDLLAAKPGRGSVSLDPRSTSAEKKGKKEWSRQNRSVGFKARTEAENRELLEAGTTKQGGRGQREPTKELESRHGTANVGPRGGGFST